MGVLLNKGGRESAKESESERDGVGGWVGGWGYFYFSQAMLMHIFVSSITDLSMKLSRLVVSTICE